MSAGRASRDPAQPRRVKASDGGPVADHDAVESPLTAERRLQQIAFGHRHAVHGVVRAHHPPSACFDCAFERCEIDLAQRAFIDPDIDREPVCLGVVGDVVLRCGRYAVGLKPAYVGGADATAEFRILTQTLEVPAAQR
jgi:hypothetical protein